MVFQYLTGYTAPNAFDGYFFAQSPGDQNKRNFVPRFANLRQGIHAGPVRKAVIGQNDVVLKAPEVIEKFFRGADDMRAALEAGLLQFVKVEFRVGRGVLNHQHSKRRRHIPSRNLGQTRGSLAHLDLSAREAGDSRPIAWSGKKAQ